MATDVDADADATDAEDAVAVIDVALPPWCAFLVELTAALTPETTTVRAHSWRETDIVGGLVRRIARAHGTPVGRVFTAVNECGLTALVGEALASSSENDAEDADAVAERERKRRECAFAVTTLERDVNLGANDGRNTKVVVLVTVPEELHPRGVLEDLSRNEALRAIKIAFLKLANDTDFVKDVRGARTAAHVLAEYESACAVLKGEHVRRATIEAEIASKRGAEFTGTFAGGIAGDVKRRWVHYKSDWTDAFEAPVKCLSATLYMYFACLGPAIAFGGLAYNQTNASVGAMEYLCSQALSGIAWAVFAGQPEIVLRPAGPQTVFLIELFKRCDSWNIDFLPTFAWVGVWTSIFMMMIAVSDACAYVATRCTKFTQDIFSLFVCAIFIFEGLKHLFEYLGDDTYSTATALFSLMLGLMTLQLGLWAVQLRSSPYMNATIREVTADFGLAVAVIIASVTAYLSGISGLETLQIPSSFTPSITTRNWWIDLSSGDAYIPLIAVGPALMLTALYYIDMNVATLLCNTPELKLRKGAAYHYNFAVLSILVLITSCLGLPPPTGSLPHSPQYVLALSDVEEYTVDGETQRKVIKVHEQRLSPLLVNVLIALSFLVVPLLRSIPMSVLFGLFVYTGITGLYENHFWERIKIAFMEPRLHPPTSYVRRVPLSRVHAFTCVQIACVGMLWGIRSSSIALAFPLFILLLMPLRSFLFKKFNIFSPEWLELLDAKRSSKQNLELHDDFDTTLLDETKDNAWLHTTAEERNLGFMTFAEVGPAFNAASLSASLRDDDAVTSRARTKGGGIFGVMSILRAESSSSPNLEETHTRSVSMG